MGISEYVSFGHSSQVPCKFSAEKNVKLPAGQYTAKNTQFCIIVCPMSILMHQMDFVLVSHYFDPSR